MVTFPSRLSSDVSLNSPLHRGEPCLPLPFKSGLGSYVSAPYSFLYFIPDGDSFTPHPRVQCLMPASQQFSSMLPARLLYVLKNYQGFLRPFIFSRLYLIIFILFEIKTELLSRIFKMIKSISHQLLKYFMKTTIFSKEKH